ncbi:MAG TPA: TIGR04076 family protein [Clostridia bacterium]|nr:TIGR04076 family protein [Clostridia bacterium]
MDCKSHESRWSHAATDHSENRKSPKGVKVTVLSVAGHCAAGIKPGDFFIVESGGAEGHGASFMRHTDGFCPEAFHNVFPAVLAVLHGGRLPWEDAEGVARVSCPDPNARVVMGVSRITD